MKRRRFLRNVAVGSVGLASLPAMVRSTAAGGDPAQVGTWEVLGENSQVLAVHAALLPTGPGGQILYFGGDEHDKGRHNRGLIDHTRLFDCATGQITTLPSPTTDVFCSGHAFLGDGRLLVAGGTESFATQDLSDFHHGHYPGIPSTWVFDPTTWEWSRASEMSDGRWYPTLVTLSDGQLLALCGHPSESDHQRHVNNTLELFSPATGRWTDQGRTAAAPVELYLGTPYPMYPRVHLLPDGQLFCATPMPRPDGSNWKWDPNWRTWSVVAPGPGIEYNLWLGPSGLEANTQKGMTSVLLPLLPEAGYRARVLIFGAARPRLIDLGSPSPVWQDTSPRTLWTVVSNQPPVRHHACCVLLPDGSALIVGGSQDNTDLDTVRAAERYEPATGQWSTLAEATVPRQYHSTALLMPDGRVWTAGSNHDGKESFRNDLLSPSDADEPGVDNRELRIELFSPPYLFRGPRPLIEAAPDILSLPGAFEVGTPDGSEVERGALLRCGSVTHAFDFDQRSIGLAVQNRAASSVTLVSPPDHHIAPPGYYLLFLLSRQNVPSVGRFIRVV